jgi:hypothetical protein
LTEAPSTPIGPVTRNTSTSADEFSGDFGYDDRGAIPVDSVGVGLRQAVSIPTAMVTRGFEEQSR